MVIKRLLLGLIFWAGSLFPVLADLDAYDFFTMKTLMTNWFKPGVSFSAQMSIHVRSPKYSGTLTVDTYMEGPAFRADGSLTNMVSEDISEAGKKLATGFGLGHVINIARTDTMEKTVLFPAKKAYYVVTRAKPEDVVIRKVADGTETIDGHVCRRTKMFVGDDEEAIKIWFATDLQDFPIQIQVGPDLRLNFRNVKFGKQDSQLFQVPTGYTRHKDHSEIVDLAFGLGRYKKPAGKITEVHVPDSFNQGIDPKFRSRPITKADLQGMKRYQADQKALEFQKKRAAEGNATAQYDLGLRYWKGDGVDKDENVAMDLMQKAAAGGNSQAKKFLETNAKR